jgi:hypothetical protein
MRRAIFVLCVFAVWFLTFLFAMSGCGNAPQEETTMRPGDDRSDDPATGVSYAASDPSPPCDDSPPDDSSEDGGVPPVSTAEECNGLDDDADGQVDEIFLCPLGSIGNICITSCNTAGNLICTAPLCSWGFCEPFPEDCINTIDDDCNGFVDCADPVCGGLPACAPAPPDPSGASDTTVQFVYTGPVAPGTIHLDAWWQLPNGTSQSWGTVAECVDVQAGDGALNCAFALPSGTSPFEFQIVLPDGRFWGDLSCSPQGGCGATVGTLSVNGPNGSLAVSMVANNPNNQPYFNGHIETIP